MILKVTKNKYIVKSKENEIIKEFTEKKDAFIYLVKNAVKS